MTRNRARRARGFTLIELAAAGALLATLTLLVLGLIASLRHSTAMSGRGSVELAAAADLSERLRMDVRQAATARVLAPKGGGLELSGVAQIEASGLVFASDDRLESVGVSTVRYEQDERGQVTRSVDGVVTHTGPRVYEATYALRTAPSGRRLVEARWHCAADLAGEPVAEDLPAPKGLVLAIDTALNAEAEAKP